MEKVYEVKFIVECYGAREEVDDYYFTIAFYDRLFNNNLVMASARCVPAPWKFARYYFKTEFIRIPKDCNGMLEYEVRVKKKGENVKNDRKRPHEPDGAEDVEAEAEDEEFFEVLQD